MQRLPRNVLACALAASWLALAPGCRRDEITHARVPKEPATASSTLATSSMGAGAADVPPPPRPEGAASLRWTLPPGWTEEVAGGMRYATLKPPVPGKLEATVVVLSGSAGGELANVNRWRGQIGLEPIAEGSLASARKSVKTALGTLPVYDFSSDGATKSRVIAGMAVREGQTWFVKMSGDAASVSKARADFMKLLESLRFEDPSSHRP